MEKTFAIDQVHVTHVLVPQQTQVSFATIIQMHMPQICLDGT